MAKRNSKQIKNNKKGKIKKDKKCYNKSYKKIAFIVVLILTAVIVLKLITNQVKQPNYESTQIILNNENIASKLQDEIIVQNNKIYMSINDIQRYIDKKIYKEETGLIITAGSKKIATFKQNDETITINGSKQKAKNLVIEKDETIYINISELENVYDYNLKYIPNTNIVTIDNLNKKSVKAYLNKDVKIKDENSKNANIIEKVKKGNWLFYIGEQDGIAKVRTQNGNIGYIDKKSLDNFVTEREDFEEQELEDTDNKSLEYDITKKDISTYEKRLNIINLILQETIKNDKISVKITYNGTDSAKFERFKIEIVPMLKECGIKVKI